MLPLLDTLVQLRLDVSKNTIVRKMHLKLTQRIGQALLPPRVAKWRYTRGRRVLLQVRAVRFRVKQAMPGRMSTAGPPRNPDTLRAGPRLTPPAPPVSTQTGQPAGQSTQQEVDAAAAVAAAARAAEDAEGHDEVPESIERILESLLVGLRDTDTVVRWSAAKGLGRVTSRLPRELADDVVESVLELFVPFETDGAWQGACLTLGELGRRGLLLPERLPSVFPCVLRALAYDELRGAAPVGAHVRDSACYLCW